MRRQLPVINLLITATMYAAHNRPKFEANRLQWCPQLYHQKDGLFNIVPYLGVVSFSSSDEE
jgi:hypothetical protein